MIGCAGEGGTGEGGGRREGGRGEGGGRREGGRGEGGRESQLRQTD